MFRSLLGRSTTRDAADLSYRAIVERARDPAFYGPDAVPDTLEGRFELIILHAFLVMYRLKLVDQARGFSQDLSDRIFDDVDRALRDLGVGDLAVGRQVKSMVTEFYGRIAAYQDALDGDSSLEDALRRNLFATLDAPPPALLARFAQYLRTQALALRAVDAAVLMSGAVPFDPAVPS